MPSTWERRWGEPNFLRRYCVPMTREERETVSPVEGRQEWDNGLEAKMMKCTLYLGYRMEYHYHLLHPTHSQLHITLHTLTTPPPSPSPVAGDGELESTERDDMEEDRRGGEGGWDGEHTATPSSASVDSAYAVRCAHRGLLLCWRGQHTQSKMVEMN